MKRTPVRKPLDERGTAAIEFALVVLPFLGLMFAILEIGIIGFMSANLEIAVEKASREIRTGRETRATSASTFEDAVCAHMSMNPGDCRDRLEIAVAVSPSFPTADALEPPAGEFELSDATDVVLVRTSFRWPLYTPFLAHAYGRVSPDEVLISAATAFQNEPY